jgi:hypothetical protein
MGYPLSDSLNLLTDMDMEKAFFPALLSCFAKYE